MTFPGAVRVGHDPHDILARLRRQLTEHTFPNLMIFTGGGGIENCSGVPSTINEMLLQSHEGVMRVFPAWPREKPARFARLRAPGAFLVTSELHDGEVRSILIESERGRPCRLQHPWAAEQAVRLQNDSGRHEIHHGQELTFSTTPGERIVVSVGPKK
jgi:hypothetical protein